MWSRRATGLVWYGLVLVGSFVACGPTHYGSRGDEGGGSGAASAGGKSSPTSPAVAAGGRGPMTGASGGVTSSGGVGPIMMPVGGHGPDPMAAGAPPDIELPPGISDHASTLECGGNTCASVPMFGNSYHMDPCCVAGKVCGVHTALLTRLEIDVEPVCQPVRQAGSPDDSCVGASGYEVPVGDQVVPVDTWSGCCRAETGTCGVLVNRIAAGEGLLLIAEPYWGCIDGEPFFPGEGAVACGAGGAGQGGAGPDLPEAGGHPSSGG